MPESPAMLKSRLKHQADVRKARQSAARNVPKDAWGQTSACYTCSDYLRCQEMIKTGGIMPCQPQDQDAECFINRRFHGDFDQLLADHAPGGYHRPPKKQIITGA
jgi:hypothetical protein